MFDSIIHLPWDVFPLPGVAGVEYLAAMAGKGMLYAFALCLVVWFLDAATEALRPLCGATRRGRVVFFALSSLLLVAVIVGLFHLWTWPRFPVIRWASQGTKNLSLPEVGIVMLAAGLVSLALWPRSKAGPSLIRLLRLSLSLALLLAAAHVCWRKYGVFPPRVRTFALAWRECIALFALEAASLAAVAHPVWRGGWRAWKRYMPRIAWLVALGFWLHGVASVWDVPRLARISAGEACGGVEREKWKVESGNWASLQEAVDAAPDGAVVEVPAGTYGPVCTRGRAITLRAVDGPERTVIDATGARCRAALLASPRLTARLERLVVRAQRAQVLQLPNILPKVGEGRGAEPAPPGGASRLVGFTLRGGYADCGANAFGGTLEDCVLEGGAAEFCGGGAFGSRLVRCTVRHNVAAWMGGGVWGGSTEGCTVEDNAAGDFGGGVWGGVHAGLSATNNTARHYPETAATATLAH